VTNPDLTPNRLPDDPDAALRPKSLAEFVGQAALTIGDGALCHITSAPAPTALYRLHE
jgi:Holliday junction resolvasome RuvABC ATP-dependent DNA helicase subunit